MGHTKMNYFSGFNSEELKIFKRLDTPKKIQDWLEAIPVSFKGTCWSPKKVLRNNKTNCIEGAILAAAILLFHKQKPLLMDLKSVDHDFDHVVALFKKNRKWGAISKTNHAVLRFREPVYCSPRELAMSYFHEYFTDDGKKTMRGFSAPFNLLKIPGKDWLTSKKDLWGISKALDKFPHSKILGKSALAGLRRADPVEIEAGKIVQYKK